MLNQISRSRGFTRQFTADKTNSSHGPVHLGRDRPLASEQSGVTMSDINPNPSAQREQIRRWIQEEHLTADDRPFLQLREALVTQLAAHYPELSSDELTNAFTQWWLDRASVSQLHDQARRLRSGGAEQRNLASHYAALFERLGQIRTDNLSK